MRSLRYLNTILTILALLLTLNLWTAWTSTPGGDALSLAHPTEAQGIPNAGAQRREMIDLLKRVNVNLEQIQAKLESGDIRVQVRPEQQQQEHRRQEN